MRSAESEVLRLLQQTGEVYQSDIVRATGLSKSSVSEALANLEDRKLIRRMSVGRNSMVFLAGTSPPARRGKELRLGFTRAAEYPFLVPLRKALKDLGIELQFRVYENGISIARDLSLFRIDLGIAPILTLFMFYSLDAPIKMVAPAGSGGSSVMVSPKSDPELRKPTTATCTRMSTMEMLMRSAMNECVLPHVESVVYASSPMEMTRMLMSGSADVGCIWEPYATILEAQGALRLVRYSDLSEHICCALAVGNHIQDGLVALVRGEYVNSLEKFRRNPEEYTASYSAISGLDASIVRRVSQEYSYPAELSPSVVTRQLEQAGLNLPSPYSFRNAILE